MHYSLVVFSDYVFTKVDTEKLQELTEMELQGRYGYLFEHLKAKFLSRKAYDTLADYLQEVIVKSLPTMVDKHIKEQVEKQVPEQVKVQVPVYVVKGLFLERRQNKEETDKMIAKAMLQEHGRLQAEISSQIQQAIDNHNPSLVDESVRNYMCGHIVTPSNLSMQRNVEYPRRYIIGSIAQ
ncbi:hypothetical protein Tco_1497778, partial [Tanacetum coccineum]